MGTVVCRLCNGRLRYLARRFAFVHAEPGVDHAPIPVELSESELRAMHGDR